MHVHAEVQVPYAIIPGNNTLSQSVSLKRSLVALASLAGRRTSVGSAVTACRGTKVTGMCHAWLFSFELRAFKFRLTEQSGLLFIVPSSQPMKHLS